MPNLSSFSKSTLPSPRNVFPISFERSCFILAKSWVAFFVILSTFFLAIVSDSPFAFLPTNSPAFFLSFDRGSVTVAAPKSFRSSKRPSSIISLMTSWISVSVSSTLAFTAASRITFFPNSLCSATSSGAASSVEVSSATGSGVASGMENPHLFIRLWLSSWFLLV